jgi:AcrR family transcriptional regulator
MKQRARKAEDKLERRQAITRAALEIWSEGTTFAAFNMAEVAERAGLAKGTIYLYFATKESLLLSLLAEQLWAWFDEFDARLDSGSGTWSAQRVAQLWATTMESRDPLMRLLSLLETILEHNIGYEDALAFKVRLRDRSQATGERMERRLSFLRPGTGVRVIVQIRALLLGFQQMSNPSPVVQRVLEQPGMGVFRVDFTRDFTAAVVTLLQGVERASAAASSSLPSRARGAEQEEAQ